MKTVLHDRRGLWAFIVGVIAVTAGVIMHIPMFMMGKDMGFRLYGMPMGADPNNPGTGVPAAAPLAPPFTGLGSTGGAAAPGGVQPP